MPRGEGQRRLTAIHYVPAAAVVIACGVEATVAIGPAGTAVMHLSALMAWVTWFIPPTVYLAGIAVVWERRAQPRLYRTTRQGLFGMGACMAVVALCTSIERFPGLYPAAFARGLAAGAGLIVLAVVFIPASHREDASTVG
ncbi:hypothetical protein ABZW96_35775 [Nocardia sp. NPDC004168]|uniref:hypothetical protein n=1 Tax=Nocardia sp. NPDC004168 TaxID=3154452 RepID=UPI0033BA785F